MGLARDAVSYARWDARNTGGKVEVFDQQGQLPWFAAVGSLLLDGLKKVWKKLKKYPFRLIQALFRHYSGTNFRTLSSSKRRKPCNSLSYRA
jgi:hypothetical protein